MSLCMAFLLFDVRRDRSRLNGRVRIIISVSGFALLMTHFSPRLATRQRKKCFGMVPYHYEYSLYQ